MQRLIFKHKNKIMVTSLFLIITGFIAHFGFKNELIFNITFIIASIIGVLPIAIQAYQSLRVKVVSIDVLVTIAVIGAFVIKAYEESAIVTFLFLFGSYLELRTLNKTRSAIKELTDMAPETAIKVLEDGSYLEVDIEEIEIDDLILVRTGSNIPVDGIVIEGSGYVNEASITGESMAVKKELSNNVYAGTILDNGTIQIRALKIGEDTIFGKIIELVEEAQDSKSNAEKFIDKFSNFYTPLVLLIAIVVWIFTKDIPTAITVLVLGCPGALVIGIPVSHVAGIGNGARNGILLKGSEVISSFSKVDTIIFDKTGTLTTGNPTVSNIKYFNNDKEKAINYLLAVEKESTHPLAKAIINNFNETKDYKVDHTEVIKGGGIKSFISGDEILIGNESLMTNNGIKLTDEILTELESYSKKGNSIVIVAINKEIYLTLGISDEVRKGIKGELKRFRKYGVKNLVLLSGDNQSSVDLVASELGLDEAIGNMLPEDKANYLKDLQSKNQIVAFVGDGINDSPSIALADIGIAMGSGTDVAIETSDVVLINSDFNKLSHSLGLTKKIVNNMIQNIAIALGVVVLLITSLLASDWMSMSIGMLFHEASILVVIINGMRLLRFNPKNWFKSIYY